MDCNNSEHEFAYEGAGGERLDVVVTNKFSGELSVSRSRISSWISSGLVCVDYDLVTKVAYKVKPGSIISISIPPAKDASIKPDPTVDFDILFEDEEIIVINKPAGIVVHPGAGTANGTLVNGLVAYLGDKLQQIGDELRPGIVHRLDKGTSGVMIIAKTNKAHQVLSQQFLPPRKISREYLALTVRLPNKKSDGKIDLPIGRHPKHRTRMAVVKNNGKPSVTHFKLERELTHGYLLRLKLETGRTHQIRVHLKEQNAGIIGDLEYGPPVDHIPPQLQNMVSHFGHQALHAETLTFPHPITGKVCNITAPLPEDFTKLLEAVDS